MGFLLVLKAELVRSFITARRYWFATLMSAVIGYSFLMMLVYAFMNKSAAVNDKIDVIGGQFGEPGQAMRSVLGLIIGIFAFGIVGMFSQGLSGLARSGQLEQMCMSPHGLVTNFMARTLVAAISSIASSVLMLWLISISVKDRLYVEPGITFLLLALIYVNLIGFGFMVGGLVLIFKQTGQIALVIRMAMIGLAVGASEKIYEWPWALRLVAHVLPITDGALCLKMALIEGKGFDVLTHPSFRFLLISCAIWTVLGISCFKWMENWSRSKGTLGAH